MWAEEKHGRLAGERRFHALGPSRRVRKIFSGDFVAAAGCLLGVFSNFCHLLASFSLADSQNLLLRSGRSAQGDVALGGHHLGSSSSPQGSAEDRRSEAGGRQRRPAARGLTWVPGRLFVRPPGHLPGPASSGPRHSPATGWLLFGSCSLQVLAPETREAPRVPPFPGGVSCRRLSSQTPRM